MTKFADIMKAEAAAELDASDDESPRADDVNDDADDDVDDDADDDSSCLGVRRRCLANSADCNRALSDHRRYCREPNKLLHCSAVEWFVRYLFTVTSPVKLLSVSVSA